MLNRHPRTHTPSLLTSASHPPFKQPHRDLRGRESLRKQTQEISYTHRSPPHLPAPISPHFCLLSFLSYELSFSLALPPFTSDKLLCKFVECTQAKDLDEVSLFSLLKGTPLSFFFSFGYERGKKGPSWQSDKESFSERDTKRWGKKGRKSWDNIWQWFTCSSHHRGEIWT